uniref:Uncharacterized protein n=1 Tax=Physcomitrium patens TaxID=3218 RepID=A0A7I4CYT8_PHYPA
MVLDQASLLLVLVARFMVMIWECGLELSVLAAVRSRFSSALWTGGLTRWASDHVMSVASVMERAIIV